MSGSVTFCKDCGVPNWANAEKCFKCGGELEPTLAQVTNFYRHIKAPDEPPTHKDILRDRGVIREI